MGILPQLITKVLRTLWVFDIRQNRALLVSTLTYQNLQKSRVPINSILGFIIRTYKKVGFGRLG